VIDAKSVKRVPRRSATSSRTSTSCSAHDLVDAMSLFTVPVVLGAAATSPSGREVARQERMKREG